MIIVRTESGEIHARYDMDRRRIELRIPLGMELHMRPSQALELISVLERLVEAHARENG